MSSYGARICDEVTSGPRTTSAFSLEIPTVNAIRSKSWFAEPKHAPETRAQL